MKRGKTTGNNVLTVKPGEGHNRDAIVPHEQRRRVRVVDVTERAVAAERDACAVLAEEYARKNETPSTIAGARVAYQIAAAIRARGAK